MLIHVTQPESARVAIAHLDVFPSEGEEIPSRDSALVNAKGLQNFEGMGQGYVRVRVRVQNSEPSTNPYP